jgi:adenylosuccinate synthase
MGAVVVVGAQWGDEGKGKIVDIYSRHADCIVRYAGGANAGHTLVVDGDKVVFRLIPSGALNPKTQCVLGQGTVIDPQVLVDELVELNWACVRRQGRAPRHSHGRPAEREQARVEVAAEPRGLGAGDCSSRRHTAGDR